MAKKNPLTNNFLDVSQFSSNHNSMMGKNFENSFQFSNAFPGNNSALAKASLNGSAVIKQRPTSTQKTSLMAAAVGHSGNGSSAKGTSGQKKKGMLGAGGQPMRKSLNNAPTLSSVQQSNLMNTSANYGHLSQNAYDFLSNASLLMSAGTTGKAVRRPMGGNSAIESRCSQTKDNTLGLAKSQAASNTAFGYQPQLNNTSHTTIVSNRKQGEIVSGKKNSLQQQQQ